MLLSLGKRQLQQEYLNSFNYLSACADGEEMPARYAARCCDGIRWRCQKGAKQAFGRLERCQRHGGKGWG